MDEKKYLDLESGLERVRGNKKLFRRMLDLFLKSAEFASLEEAIAADDHQKAEASAHSIKGVAGNLSLTLLFETSAKLMEEYRKGAPQMETIAEYREVLKDTIACVEEAAARLDAAD